MEKLTRTEASALMPPRRQSCRRGAWGHGLAMAGLGVLLVVSPAAAQPASPERPAATRPATSLSEITDPDRVVPPWDVTVARLREAGVHGPKGDRIGSVEAVLEDAAGQVTAVVVRFRSALGTGESAVAVPFGQLDLRGDRLVSKLAKEQLGAMPLWQK